MQKQEKAGDASLILRTAETQVETRPFEILASPRFPV